MKCFVYLRGEVLDAGLADDDVGVGVARLVHVRLGNDLLRSQKFGFGQRNHKFCSTFAYKKYFREMFLIFYEEDVLGLADGDAHDVLAFLQVQLLEDLAELLLHPVLPGKTSTN